MPENRKIDLLNLWIPTYQIQQSRVPVAIIKIGKQGYVRKLPPKSRYFIDKDFGLFEIKPDAAIMINRTELYIYDHKNQNPIEVGKLQRLLRWANRNGIYEIKRADLNHAIKLRAKDLKRLTEEADMQKKAIRQFINQVKETVKAKNTEIISQKKAEVGLEDNPDEYPIISKEQENYIIVDNLYENGYIDNDEATLLKTRLRKKEIQTQEELLKEIDRFSEVMIHEPIPFELERFLKEFHTFDPAAVTSVIVKAVKIYKGFKNLRTKPVVNWFPWTYILGGCLGAGIIIMMLMNYWPQDLSTINPLSP
jgi:hypothetical protein